MEVVSIPEADYPSIFSWREETIELADKVYKSYLEVLLESIISVLEEYDSQLLKCLNTLQYEAQRLILESPETYYRLNSVLRGESEISLFINFIRICIDVEQAKNGDISINAIHKWSANGDTFIDDQKAELKISHSGWLVSGSYRAKKIKNIPIDHASIYARAKMPVAPFRSVQYGEPSPFLECEAEIAEQKIIEAYSCIEKSCPYAAKYITKYVKSIILRKNTENQEVFQSASRNAFIGQIVLLNPHAEHVDISYLAESLVHEAIHSLMWRQEILSHFLLDPLKDMGTVISPWSGEKIYYYTMLQAVFVWYGISCFWYQAMKLNYFPKERSELLYKRAIAGFQGDSLMEALTENKNNLQIGILDEFRKLINLAQNMPFLERNNA